MNHEHMKKCHYRSLHHDFLEQFSKHALHSGGLGRNCITVTCFFLFFFFFFLFSFLFFFFFLLGLAPVGEPAFGFQLRKCFLRSTIFFFSLFLFFSFFFFSFFLLFFDEEMQKYENNEQMCLFFKKKKEIIYVLQGCSWRDVLRKTLQFFALWWHFGSQSLVWSVARFHFNFRKPMSSSANGPLARTAKRHREVDPMMAGMNPFLASMFGPAFALLVPTRAESCWFCFDGSMRYVATRDQKRHWFLMWLMCLFCQLLSDRVASVVKTKSVLIGFSLNRLNRMK